MTVTDENTTIVETLEEAAFLLEEDPNLQILIVPKGTLENMWQQALLKSVQL